MNDDEKEQDLFLLDQKIFRLSDDVPRKYRRFHVCGDGEPPKERERKAQKLIWEPTVRLRPEVPDGKPPTSLVGQAFGDDPWMRVALVCEAGLGKTTNMRWLQAHLAMPGSRVLPLLLQLHTPELDLLLRDGEQAGFLLDHLAKQMAGDDKNTDRHLHHLKKLKAQGRITLLIDGLDHGLSQVENLTDILNTMLENTWANCPVWISGRPSAFSLAWPLVQRVQRGNWRFLHVEGLRVPDIRFYLDEQVEPDEKDPTKRSDWYSALPEDGRELLAIPRFLHLVAGELRDEVAAAKESGADPFQAIEVLDLHTRADVYRLAYFSRGEDVSARGQIAGKDDEREKRGLIAQGLDACYLFEDGQTQYLGQKKGEPKDDKKLARRIRFTAGLLGAIAFEMYANPHKYGARKNHAKDAPLQPNTASIPETEMDAFEDAVRARLLDADARRAQALAGSPLFKPEYIENAFLILGANNRTVDYVMFHEVGEKGLAWHDPTVQAFFAAYWAVNYVSPMELEAIERWRVVRGKDESGRENLLRGYDEFWQFAAEMPYPLLFDSTLWVELFRPCYVSPQQMSGDHVWVQWHRRMVHDTFARMLIRSEAVIRQWKESFPALANGSENQRRIFAEIEGGFREIAAGICQYRAPEWGTGVGESIRVLPFRMHQYEVTNEMFEEFSPDHYCSRWSREFVAEKGGVVTEARQHPLQKEAEDRCPVVNITYYDAWCFAAWCGHRLPTDLEWEHACRAGSTTRFYFGDEISELPKHAWVHSFWRMIRINADGKLEKATNDSLNEDEFGHMHPVGALAKNANGLYDLYGNVYEWCDRSERGKNPGSACRWIAGAAFEHLGPFHTDPENIVASYFCNRIGFRLASGAAASRG